MAKRGGSNHYVRLRSPRNLPVVSRKGQRWLLAPNPGPHGKEESVSAGVLLRDVLHMAEDMREAKKILNEGNFEIDGKKIHNIRFPVGLMDIIGVPKKKLTMRVQLQDGRLFPKEISHAAAKLKLCKVIGKKSVAGGKIALATHDGRTLVADNDVKVGATIRMEIPKFKLKDVLPLSPGVKCLVTEGTHAGTVAVLEKIIERTGSMDSEAQLKAGATSFVTVTKYLFVVDEEFA